MDTLREPLCTAEEMARYEVAADWVQRLADPRVDEAAIHEWLEWFGACDANRRAFEDLHRLRLRLGALPAAERAELRRRAGGAWPAAAAVEGPDDAPGGEPRRGAGDTPPSARRPGAWRLAGLAAAAMLVLVGVWIALAVWRGERAAQAVIYAAPARAHRTIVLPDGSSVVLASDSIIEVRYPGDRRLVQVRQGEAYFEVRRDPRRPFVVSAGGIRVTAVGTAFNVQRRRDRVAVTVTEGSVRVSQGGPDRARRQTPAAAPRAGESLPRREADRLHQETQSSDGAAASELVLAAGQRTELPLADTQVAAAVSAADAVPQWVDDRVVFIDARLSDVLSVVNPYAPRKVVIYDPRVGDLTFTGTIIRSYVGEWIASLPYVYPVRPVPLEDGTLTLVSRDRPAGTTR